MQTAKPLPLAPPVNCEHCAAEIFNGEVIKSRVIDPFRSRAKCSWCKNWTPVPITYRPTP